MRIKIIIPVILFSFIFSGVAHAQITVLPQAIRDGKTLSNAECKPILDNFGVTGKVPSLSDSLGQKSAELSKNADNADSNVEKAQQSLNEAQAKVDNIAEHKAAAANAVPVDGNLVAKLADQYDSAAKARDQAKQNLLQAKQDAQKAHEDANKAFDDVLKNATNTTPERDILLGCAIKTGRISLAMLPYFVTYFANYLLGIVGILVVLFIVLGGYFYIWGGLTEKKEKGKQYITHALMGLAVASIAWILVNAVMALFTS